MQSGIDAKGKEGRDVIEGKLRVDGKDLTVYSLGGLVTEGTRSMSQRVRNHTVRTDINIYKQGDSCSETH
jgi:hypothetical protein